MKTDNFELQRMSQLLVGQELCRMELQEQNEAWRAGEDNKGTYST
jgi:hypothetical protein